MFDETFWTGIYSAVRCSTTFCDKVSSFDCAFQNYTISFFVCVALRAAFWGKITISLFCLCCTAGGVDLKKPQFLYLSKVLQVPKHMILVGFEHRECSRTISFEK